MSLYFSPRLKKGKSLDCFENAMPELKWIYFLATVSYTGPRLTGIELVCESTVSAKY